MRRGAALITAPDHRKPACWLAGVLRERGQRRFQLCEPRHGSSLRSLSARDGRRSREHGRRHLGTIVQPGVLSERIVAGRQDCALLRHAGEDVLGRGWRAVEPIGVVKRARVDADDIGEARAPRVRRRLGLSLNVPTTVGSHAYRTICKGASTPRRRACKPPLTRSD